MPYLLNATSIDSHEDTHVAKRENPNILASLSAGFARRNPLTQKTVPYAISAIKAGRSKTNNSDCNMGSRLSTIPRYKSTPQMQWRHPSTTILRRKASIAIWRLSGPLSLYPKAFQSQFCALAGRRDHILNLDNSLCPETGAVNFGLRQAFAGSTRGFLQQPSSAHFSSSNVKILDLDVTLPRLPVGGH